MVISPSPYSYIEATLESREKERKRKITYHSWLSGLWINSMRKKIRSEVTPEMATPSYSQMKKTTAITQLLFNFWMNYGICTLYRSISWLDLLLHWVLDLTSMCCIDFQQVLEDARIQFRPTWIQQKTTRETTRKSNNMVKWFSGSRESRLASIWARIRSFQPKRVVNL
jgi:hypothetical protein